MRWLPCRVFSKTFFTLLFLVFVAVEIPTTELWAEDIFSPRGYVSDLAGVLPSADQVKLAQMLGDFEHKKGAQVLVVIVRTTSPLALEEYSIQLAQRSKAGRQNVDDGAILLVAKDDRKIRIEVGYGLEGAIPDAVAKRIIEEIILPAFRAGNFPLGINNGVQAIIARISGENLPAFNQGQSLNTAVLLIFILLIFLMIYLQIRYGGFVVQPPSGATWDSGYGKRRRSTWGGDNWGGGGYGGGSSGGFTGGGGSFGGGGASGSW